MKNIILLLTTFLISTITITGQNSTKPIEVVSVFGGHYFKQEGNRLSQNDVLQLMESNKEAYALMKKSKANNTWALILGGIGGGLIGWPLGASIAGGDAQWELAAVGAGFVIGAIPLVSSAKKKAKKAVDLYNGGLNATPYTFDPEVNLKFNGATASLKIQF